MRQDLYGTLSVHPTTSCCNESSALSSPSHDQRGLPLLATDASVLEHVTNVHVEL